MDKSFKRKLKRRMNILKFTSKMGIKTNRTIRTKEVDDHLIYKFSTHKEITKFMQELCGLFNDMGYKYVRMISGKKEDFPTLTLDEFLLTEKKETFKDEILELFKNNYRLENVLDMIEIWED